MVEVDGSMPDVARSEVNFLVLPFFALWDKDVKKRTETEFKAVLKRGNKRLEIFWNVSANSKFGYPGPFDKKVYKAIEQIIGELTRPIQNPIPLGSFHNLCKRMELKTQGGKIYHDIKESLQRITLTGIVSKGAFYSKEKEKLIEDTFHLYERFISRGEKLLNGEIADTNYLYLNNWYLDNINANYVKPLDWNYYTSLKTPLAQRLYELLSVKFYGVIMRGGRKLSYRYSTLCDLLPATRQKYRSKAKQILDPAHEKLKETGFLADYRWPSTSKTKGDWLIIYYPGSRVREEIEKSKTYFKLPELPEPELEYLPEPESEAEPAKPKPTPVESPRLRSPQSVTRKRGTPPQPPLKEGGYREEEEALSPIAQELINRGITKAVALDFADSFPEDYLLEKIALHDYQKDIGELTTNAAGWLREAIVHDYKPSEQQLKKQAQVEQKKAQQEEQRTLEEKAREIQEARLTEALAQFPSSEKTCPPWCLQPVLGGF
ncbi:MAG: replication initiator protein A [Candidatus Omnitrophica bacterium]|nr:replication initiator protein A [Candidatus Omnitrophota bacterium]